jgi:hypothetical protein
VDEPEPDALNVTGLLLHEAVRLAGNPLTLRLTGPLKEPPAVNVKVWLVLLWAAVVASRGLMTVILLELLLIANVGAGANTVNVSFWLTVSPSPVAVKVMVDEPVAAEADAASVSVEEPVSAVRASGLLLHEAVTPVGNPLTLKLTAPV